MGWEQAAGDAGFMAALIGEGSEDHVESGALMVAPAAAPVQGAERGEDWRRMLKPLRPCVTHLARQVCCLAAIGGCVSCSIHTKVLNGGCEALHGLQSLQ